ncbi:MAG: PD40 domain-containing protein, partial [Phycisphaerales bacterium]|nr:PD40 domain-containing protein [Phycisphaerales bacterium]
GRHVDRRTDAWAFGVILYECLTGVCPFAGETPQDAIGAVLHKQIDFDLLPGETPAALRRLLHRCLQRDKRERLRDLGDARLELLAAREELHAPAPVPAAHSTNWWPWLIAVVAVVIAALAFLAPRPAPGPTETGTPSRGYTGPVRLELPPPVPGATSAFDHTIQYVALSPDGGTIAVTATTGTDAPVLYVRRLSDNSYRALDGLKHPTWPVFSPDGRWIAVLDNYERLVRVSVDGGPVQRIVDVDPSYDFSSNLVWTEDDDLIYCDEGEELKACAITTAEIRVLMAPDPDLGKYGFGNSAAVPGGRYLLVTSWDSFMRPDVYIGVYDFETGSFRQLIRNASYPHVFNGELAFLRDDALYAVSFDASTATISGDPRLLVDGVTTSEWNQSALADVASNGTIIHVPGHRRCEGRRMVRFSRTGETQPFLPGTAPYKDTVDLSRDGSRLVTTTLADRMELWIHDLTTGGRTRHLLEGEVYRPMFSPDGKDLIFLLFGRDPREFGRFEIATGRYRTLTQLSELEEIWPATWISDNEMLGTHRPADGSPYTVTRFTLEPWSMESIIATEHSNWGGWVSPDGQWLLFGSDRSGENEIFVRRYPDGTRDWPVSHLTAHTPRWSHDGSRIYYIESRTDKELYEVTFSPGGDGTLPVLGQPTRLFSTNSLFGVDNYVPLPDDQGFLMIDLADWEKAPQRLMVTLPGR